MSYHRCQPAEGDKPKGQTTIDMKSRQAPLMRAYVDHPEQALIVDRAATHSHHVPTADAIHTTVEFGMGNPAIQKIGVHRAVGGECDDPNPGELLAAAVASCLDTTVRIIANRLGLPLTRLAVSVDAFVDVRGTLRVARDVPVGFEKLDIAVDIETAVPVAAEQLSLLMKAAEKSCVVLQTLKNPPAVRLTDGGAGHPASDVTQRDRSAA